MLVSSPQTRVDVVLLSPNYRTPWFVAHPGARRHQETGEHHIKRRGALPLSRRQRKAIPTRVLPHTMPAARGYSVAVRAAPGNWALGGHRWHPGRLEEDRADVYPTARQLFRQDDRYVRRHQQATQLATQHRGAPAQDMPLREEKSVPEASRLAPMAILCVRSRGAKTRGHAAALFNPVWPDPRVRQHSTMRQTRRRSAYPPQGGPADRQGAHPLSTAPRPRRMSAENAEGSSARCMSVSTGRRHRHTDSGPPFSLAQAHRDVPE